MTDLEKQIDNALHCDVDLSPADYKSKMEEADKATASHGVEGKASISESVRARRIALNFYGTMLNVTLSLLAEVSNLSALVEHQNKLLSGRIKNE